MSEELCFLCQEPTGRAGAGDDSIYSAAGSGPYCECCWAKANRTSQVNAEETSDETVIDVEAIFSDLAYIDIVFDGPPAPESGRFVEVNDHTGASINAGDWLEMKGTSSNELPAVDFWVLRIPGSKILEQLKDRVAAKLEVVFKEGYAACEMQYGQQKRDAQANHPIQSTS